MIPSFLQKWIFQQERPPSSPSNLRATWKLPLPFLKIKSPKNASDKKIKMFFSYFMFFVPSCEKMPLILPILISTLNFFSCLSAFLRDAPVLSKHSDIPFIGFTLLSLSQRAPRNPASPSPAPESSARSRFSVRITPRLHSSSPAPITRSAEDPLSP